LNLSYIAVAQWKKRPGRFHWNYTPTAVLLQGLSGGNVHQVASFEYLNFRTFDPVLHHSHSVEEENGIVTVTSAIVTALNQ